MDPESDGLTKLEQDLRATTEDLAADAARVKEIERRKGDLPADHPLTMELSEESEALTARMAEKAKVETALVEKAQG